MLRLSWWTAGHSAQAAVGWLSSNIYHDLVTATFSSWKTYNAHLPRGSTFPRHLVLMEAQKIPPSYFLPRSQIAHAQSDSKTAQGSLAHSRQDNNSTVGSFAVENEDIERCLVPDEDAPCRMVSMAYWVRSDQTHTKHIVQARIQRTALNLNRETLPGEIGHSAETDRLRREWRHQKLFAGRARTVAEGKKRFHSSEETLPYHSYQIQCQPGVDCLLVRTGWPLVADCTQANSFVAAEQAKTNIANKKVPLGY